MRTCTSAAFRRTSRNKTSRTCSHRAETSSRPGYSVILRQVQKQVRDATVVTSRAVVVVDVVVVVVVCFIHNNVAVFSAFPCDLNERRLIA